MNTILLSTTSIIDGWDITKYIDLVSARIVTGTGFFNDLFAGISDFTGGNSEAYQKQLKDINTQALKLLEMEALSVKANAVIGIKIDYDEITGKGKQMFMVTATGTAVLAKKRDKEIEKLDCLLEDFIDEEFVSGKVKNMQIRGLKIERLFNKIKESQLTFEVKEKIFQYYSVVGKYSKAEDLLFKVLSETYSSNLLHYENMVDAGISFYEGLLLKTDAELEQGDLPRDEVEEALNTLKEKKRSEK